MQPDTNATTHRAGPVVDTTQRCTDCGAVLLDLVRGGFPEGEGVVLHRHPTDPPGEGPTRGTRADLFDGEAPRCTEARG